MSYFDREPEHVEVGEDGSILETHDPGMTIQQVDQLYAVLAAGDDGEGVVAVQGDDGMMLPLVTSSEEAITRYAQIAATMGRTTNRTMRIVEFSTRRVISTVYEAEERP